MEKNLSIYDEVYGRYLSDVLWNGVDVDDRTGTGTREIFSKYVDYGSILESFPLLTIKQTPFKAVLGELLWFIEGSTNEQRLSEITFGAAGKKTIWTDNANAPYWTGAKEPGDLGNIYGKMWRSWPVQDVTEHRTSDGILLSKTVQTSAIDQLDRVIEGLKSDPSSRRHLVLAWNPGEQTPDKVALPPCHYGFQFNVNPKYNTLNLLVNMRSNDILLGAPFNVASYALLQYMVAQVTGLNIGNLSFMIGSAHIYQNHFDGAQEVLNRLNSNEGLPASPKLRMDREIKHIDDFKMSSFELIGYNPLPRIPLPMAT